MSILKSKRTLVNMAAAAACGAAPCNAAWAQDVPAPAAAAASAPAQPASAAAAAAPASASSENLTKVVISGIRDSLVKSADLKREAIGTRDSIVAEDIGKFPEQNIADALVRLPGIEVVRDPASNEGQRIQLRGLGSQYTITTFNGAPVRTTSSGNIGSSTRDFNYDVFASELFSRADVYKTSLAELEEGGVAGVVDLQTPRPFDKPGKVIRYSLAGAYNDLSGATSPRGHVLLSNTWDNVGFLVSVAASRARNATAGFQSTGTYSNTLQRTISGSNFTFNTTDPRANLGSVTLAQLNEANLPRFIRVVGQDNLRERVGWNTSLQYKSGNLDVSWDTLYSRLKDDTKTNYLNFPVRDSTGANALIPIDIRVDANNNLQGTLGNFTMVSNALNSVGETKFGYNALNARYQLGDLRLVGQVTSSKSVGERNDATLTAQDLTAGGRHTVTFDLSNPFAPSISTNRDLQSPGSYTDFGYTGSYRTETDQQRTAKLVGEYAWGVGPVEARTKVGVSSVRTTKIANSYLAGNLLNSQVIPGVGLYGAATPAQRTAYMQSLLTPNDLANVAADSGGQYPTQWLTFSRDYIYGNLDALNRNRASAPNLGGTFKAIENIKSLFVQSDFESTVFGRALRANAGVRYVKTDTDIDNYLLVTGTYEPRNPQGGYTNTLPSLSLAYDVVENVVFRTSVSKTFTRSSISSIARAFDVPNAGNLVINAGNVDLKPEQSRSLDAAVEWYPAKGAVAAVSAFQKDISGRLLASSSMVPFNSLGLPATLFTSNIQTQLAANPATPVELRSFVNADSFKIKGLELAYQQAFTFLPAPFNGLGTIASYTDIQTDGVVRTYNGVNYELPIVPKKTYALTLYYEQGPLSLRSSYNHKSEYANFNQTATNVFGYQRWFNARGYLDATVGYRINSQLEVRLDVSNITKTKAYEFFRQFEGKYGDENSRIEGGAQSGRTFTLGLRGSF